MTKVGIHSYFYEHARAKGEDGNFRFDFIDGENYAYEQIREHFEEELKAIKPFGKSAFIYISSAANAYIKEDKALQIKKNIGYIASKTARIFEYDFSLLEVDANLCASGLSAIKKAYELLNKDFDSVLIYGQNTLTPDTIALFNELKLDIPLCEGVCAFLLSKKGFRSEILGGEVIYNKTDASPLSISSAGYEKAYKWAKNEKIYGVKAHASGTKANEEAELKAIEKTFGSCRYLNYKQEIGHSLDISALIELGKFLDDGIRGKWLFSASGFGNIYASLAINSI